MIIPGALVSAINKSCKTFFSESTFSLTPVGSSSFRISGSYPSKALNNYKNDREEVTVIKWFGNFWVFIQIDFIQRNTFISTSIFQGKESDNIKHQLFRAEWDDYNNDEEMHPQPHWHITANQAIEKTFEEIASMQDTDTFVSLLKEEQLQIININKIHFTMCANWMNNEVYVHRLDDVQKVVLWFNGLLTHLRHQLEYAQ